MVDDLCVFPFMRSLSAEGNAFFVRILSTITPRIYREVLALFTHRRPDFGVLLAPPESLVDGERPSASGRTYWCKTPTRMGCPMACCAASGSSTPAVWMPPSK